MLISLYMATPKFSQSNRFLPQILPHFAKAVNLETPYFPFVENLYLPPCARCVSFDILPAIERSGVAQW